MKKNMEVLILGKNDVKKILMSLRNNDNANQINNLLGKVDLLPEEKLQQMINQIGDDEESIRKYLQEKLIQTQNNRQEKHMPINKMFEYGISGSCIHLHMPLDLHEMMSQKGIKKTVDTVNMYLLDAIERIRILQNEGFYKFKDKNSIYMISPILIGREIKFLEDLDFETHSYRKKELLNEDFVAEHPEAQLAIHIFGSNSNVGTAKISFDLINSEEWQAKKNEKIKQFKIEGNEIKDEDKKMII